jgi:hypothetical protein
MRVNGVASALLGTVSSTILLDAQLIADITHDLDFRPQTLQLIVSDTNALSVRCRT